MKTNIKFFKKTKTLPVDKFFQNVLYDKKNGYYNSKTPIGSLGDFITAPSISNLFSEMIAIWIVSTWEIIGKPKNINIVELGPGNGSLTKILIKVFKRFPEFNKSNKIYLLEISSLLKKIQKNNLKNFDLKWIKNLAEIRNGVNLFIGNEFLDSLTVKQFIKKNDEWYERYIVEDKNLRKIVNIKININKYEKKFGINFSNKQNFIELPIKQIQFINLISDYIKRNEGGVLFIDYGYNGGKMFDSLQAVKNHKKVNYLDNKGKVDITHLINFDLLKKIFKRSGLKVNGLISQELFLKKIGIFERAELITQNLPFLQKSDIYYRINRLTDKKQMGDLFNVIFASSPNINFKFGFK